VAGGVGQDTANRRRQQPLGTATETVVIDPSEGPTVVGIAANPVSHFTDAAGDPVTISTGGKQGARTYARTNATGAISGIDPAGTDSAKTTATVTAKTPEGGAGSIRPSTPGSSQSARRPAGPSSGPTTSRQKRVKNPAGGWF
jgi:hypothetical protein